MNSVTFAKAMADNTRQQIMHLLCCQWICVGDIVDQTGVSQPTVSHHLHILRNCDLIASRKEGKNIYYYVKREVVNDMFGNIVRKMRIEIIEEDN